MLGGNLGIAEQASWEVLRSLAEAFKEAWACSSGLEASAAYFLSPGLLNCVSTFLAVIGIIFSVPRTVSFSLLLLKVDSRVPLSCQSYQA